ncbi:DNA polymerase III subunit alpha [Neglectibacter caecimuris]|uniref:DNA polymerase III subunit alpha n=1 Tax=Neglectibacter caecimuris TaxID=3093658 RepID=UPI002AC937AA|nr:DNA polymerase III subunit alpha [Neglectibacter sp. M00184]
MAFAHLHLHTEYSLLDGACRIERLLDKVQELGQTSVAITDHGCMYGVIEFYKAAKKRGIKPILGCEVYVAKRTRFDRVHELDSENRHLVLLCENEAGYRNLIAMVSKSWTEGFYNRPRVDFELLEQHHEGLIALSACLAGEIPKALSRNDYAGAKEAALRYREIFGPENFFLEIQDHGLENQHYVNPQIIRLSKETGIPLVVTNDCHYIEKEDSAMHHVLICIQTGRTVEDEDTLEFGSEEFYVKSEAEMRALFPELPEAADNTAKIAERCRVEIEFGKTKLPRFDPPDGSDSESFFKSLCFEGLKKRYGEQPEQSLLDRLSYEISVISQMGYVNYYLIVWDFIRYAKSVGIPVGPGRGSGAGSLCAYCVGITNVDPIRYGLIFERFLNAERVSMPDFDIDFSDERRDEIIQYVLDRYGADHVAQIVTFGTMAARGALRDAGRAMAIPYNKVDQVAKQVPMELGITLDAALKSSQSFRAQYESDEQVKALVDMARKLEGMPRHASTHAAGVLITDRPVTEYVPLAKNDDVVVTQFTMTAIEELGLLKMDFLGLRNLSVIDNAQKLIRRREPDFSIEAIPEDDGETFRMMAQADSVGVFQFESGGMKRLLSQAEPESIEDLIAIISLYRPGPMQFIPMYIENRKHPDRVVYRHEKLKPILDVTYGCIIYQEQVMQIFRELAGYSLGRADIVRRAMAKKKRDVLEKERQIFLHGQRREDGSWEVEGCLNRGVDQKTAEELFREIESFASYAFNKSHAAAYAVVAYQTAYLKRHYPREYMASLLSSVLGWAGKVAEYMEECKRLRISVLPPHVNESDMGFTVAGETIRYGLLAVKNLGRAVILRMVEERRRSGAFISFYNFCKRMSGKDLNRKAIESLIKCGALDGLGNNRREMLLSVESVLNSLETDKRRNLEGQMGLFDTPGTEEGGEPALQKAEEFSVGDKLAMEKEVTGMYLSGHPMMDHAELYETGRYARSDEIFRSSQGDSELYRDGQQVTLLVMIAEMRRKNTKNGGTMAFLTLEDMYGAITGLVFPKTLEGFADLLEGGAVVEVSGRLSFTEDQEPELICMKFSKPGQGGTEGNGRRPAAQSGGSGRPGLYLKLDSKEDPRYKKAMEYLAIFDEGRTDVYLFFRDSQKLMKAPARFRAELNDTLLFALEKLLGEENVAVRN